MEKLKTFDSICFRGKSHFEEDGMQFFLVFQQIQRYLKEIVNLGNDSCVCYWKSKGLSDETILLRHLIMEILHTIYYDTNKIRVKFNGGCLKQDQAMLLHGGIVFME